METRNWDKKYHITLIFQLSDYNTIIQKTKLVNTNLQNYPN